MMSTALAQYDAMRMQVQQCARTDEAAEIRNRADKLRAYAKQKKDYELQRWMGEIFCRATIRYGELSKGMQKAKHGGAGGGSKIPPVGKSKSEQIKASGLSKSAAQRAEALAGARSDLDDEMAVEALGISLDAAEVYFQQCRKQKTTPNQRQLATLVNQALDTRFGKPKRAPRKRKRSALTNAFIDWTAAVDVLATLNPDLVALAAHELCTAHDLDAADKAMTRLQQWLELLEEKHVGIGGSDLGTRTVREGPHQVPPP
jgi:hypothetical protein